MLNTLRKNTEKDFLHLLHEIRTIRHTRIKERLIIKEKLKLGRQFKDMTKGLTILSTNKEGFLFSKEQREKSGSNERLIERNEIRDKIDRLYSSLSRFSHVTLDTLDLLADWEKGTGFRDREAIYYLTSMEVPIYDVL